MIYAMSDIHGQYQKYLKMLNEIKFENRDKLYILGDVINRGECGIEILLDMMKRQNVIPLIGNHEIMAIRVMKKAASDDRWIEETRELFSRFSGELEAECLGQISADRCLNDLVTWIFNGGAVTLASFLRHGKETQTDIIDYLSEFLLYDEIILNDGLSSKKFHLSHTLPSFDEYSENDEIPFWGYTWDIPDYEKVYSKDIYLFPDILLLAL